MRVISGKVRGLKLISPPGEDTRPTLDRVKEAVFSMISPFLMDAKVLDLFSGSGALGIESLSRGALNAVFVDNSNISIKCIRSNIEAAKFDNVSTILQKDSAAFLNENKNSYDIIFLDPPYLKNMYTKTLEEILKNNALSQDGIIVLEYDHTSVSVLIPDGFTVIKEKKYGRVGVMVLKRG